MIGNISLGFMLGMSSIVNKILGIPFDIRHITISAGNVSIALYGLGIRNVPLTYLISNFFRGAGHWIFKLPRKFFPGIYSGGQIPWSAIKGLSGIPRNPWPVFSEKTTGFYSAAQAAFRNGLIFFP